MEYEKDLTIDAEMLDVEWVKQPRLYMKYSELSAQADKECQKAKENLDAVVAQLDSEIRKTAQMNETKITEAAIRNTLILRPEYKKAFETYTEKTYQASIISAAVKAFEHRKKALESLVQLWIGSYFSGPKQPRDASSISDMVEQSARGKLRERMNRKQEDNNES